MLNKYYIIINERLEYYIEREREREMSMFIDNKTLVAPVRIYMIAIVKSYSYSKSTIRRSRSFQIQIVAAIY